MKGCTWEHAFLQLRYLYYRVPKTLILQCWLKPLIEEVTQSNELMPILR